MITNLTGIHRVLGSPGCPNDVRVSGRDRSFYITEAEYRQREIRPPYEALTWRADS
jgi:hypothetical protein